MSATARPWGVPGRMLGAARIPKGILDFEGPGGDPAPIRVRHANSRITIYARAARQASRSLIVPPIRSTAPL